MKKIFVLIFVALSVVIGRAQETTLFPYPEVPSDITDYTERANYAVAHFWDKFAFNRPVSDKELFGQTFYDYLTIITLADVDVALQSLNAFLERLDKEPDKLLEVGLLAEDMCYTPGGRYVSDQLYLPIAKAVYANKKIKGADKARFGRQAQVIEQTLEGVKAPDLSFVTPEGRKMSLNDVYGKYIILFFNDPDCGDCALARVRLSADININERIKAGELTIVSIFPEAPDDSWREAASSWNSDWIVGAAENADEIYDIRLMPTIYYLRPNHKILAKDVTVDQLLEGFRNVNTKRAGE